MNKLFLGLIIAGVVLFAAAVVLPWAFIAARDSSPTPQPSPSARTNTTTVQIVSVPAP